MKKTAPDRLSEAIAGLLVRNFDFCKKHTHTGLRIGICVATPKIASLSVPSQELMEQLKEHAQTHFASLQIQAIYFSYLVPPLLPIVDEKDKCCPPSVDDFHLTYRMQEFDESWARETVGRSLIYCPSECEMGEWHDWFVPQLEAIRLTPLCFEWLREYEIVGNIQMSFRQSGIPVFETFVRTYVLNDDHLGISVKERKLVSEGQINWRIYYPEVKNIFDIQEQTLLELYKVSRTKVVPFVKTKNHKT